MTPTDKDTIRELRECPFCGSRAELHKSEKTTGFFVRCAEFDCSTVKSGNTKTAALKAWNNRPTPAMGTSGICEKCGKTVTARSAPWSCDCKETYYGSNEISLSQMLEQNAAMKAKGKTFVTIELRVIEDLCDHIMALSGAQAAPNKEG